MLDRAMLDGAECCDPECTREHDQQLHLHSACHPGVPLDVAVGHSEELGVPLCVVLCGACGESVEAIGLQALPSHIEGIDLGPMLEGGVMLWRSVGVVYCKDTGALQIEDERLPCTLKVIDSA